MTGASWDRQVRTSGIWYQAPLGLPMVASLSVFIHARNGCPLPENPTPGVFAVDPAAGQRHARMLDHLGDGDQRLASVPRCQG